MPEWVWNGKRERWILMCEQQCRLARQKGRLKYYANKIEVLVVRSKYGQDAQLRAIASAYAARLDFLQAAISTYLDGRPIKVYGGFKDPHQYCEIVHPEKPGVDIRTIELLDAQYPKRVHILVDTCYPDPYFDYEIIFEDMEIVDVSGRVS
ncbi:MAG: hypothetical protein AB8B99_18260 [Phormidesmis sp.]